MESLGADSGPAALRISPQCVRAFRPDYLRIFNLTANSMMPSASAARRLQLLTIGSWDFVDTPAGLADIVRTLLVRTVEESAAATTVALEFATSMAVANKQMAPEFLDGIPVTH